MPALGLFLKAIHSVFETGCDGQFCQLSQSSLTWEEFSDCLDRVAWGRLSCLTVGGTWLRFELYKGSVMLGEKALFAFS